MAIYDDIFDKLIGGRYRITKKLGEGAFGKVYLADQEVAGIPGVRFRQVALKLFTHDFVSAGNAGKVFGEAILLDELAAAARSRGEAVHLVNIFDIGVMKDYDSMPYVAMERVHGSLDDELKKAGGMPLTVLIRHIRGICAGLRLAHGHSPAIIHRDLKPANVLIEANGFLKVADFGLAIDRWTAFQSHGFAGTISYAPPESRAGGVSMPSFDVYSLGVMMVEMLLKQNPLAEVLRSCGSNRGCAEKVLDDAQQKLAELIDPVTDKLLTALSYELYDSKPMQDVFKRCLAMPTSGDRYANAMELDSALEDVEAGRVRVETRKPSASGRQTAERVLEEVRVLLEQNRTDEAKDHLEALKSGCWMWAGYQARRADLLDKQGHFLEAIEAQRLSDKAAGRGDTPELVRRMIKAGQGSAAKLLAKKLGMQI